MIDGGKRTVHNRQTDAAVNSYHCAVYHCAGFSCSISRPNIPPFPQIDSIGAVVIVWRARGKIIRSVLFNIVCNSCTQ